MSEEKQPTKSIPPFLRDEGFAIVTWPPDSPLKSEKLSPKEEEESEAALGKCFDALSRALTEHQVLKPAPELPQNKTGENLEAVENVFKSLRPILGARNLLNLSTLWAKHVVANVDMEKPDKKAVNPRTSFVFMEGKDLLDGILFLGPNHQTAAINTPFLEDNPEVALTQLERFLGNTLLTLKSQGLELKRGFHAVARLKSGKIFHSLG